MADFDAKYDIRQANIDDIDAIMEYIDDDWRKGHIMARNREMFEYEFLEDDGSVNVVIAIDRDTGRIEGMIGYLYSSKEEGKRDVWGSIWKVRDGNMSLLGVEIMKRMETISKCRYNLGTGANPKTNIPLMRVMFRRTADKMKHYYRMQQMDYSECVIAKIVNEPQKSGCEDNTQRRVDRITDINELKSLFEKDSCSQAVPYKDMWYVNKKFANHPVYDYKIYGICSKDAGETEADYDAAFVVRRQEACGKSCLRIVDYIGDFSAIKDTYNFFTGMLEECEDAEYIDFYCLGMSDSDMADAGFLCIADNDENIIPNYFSPFVQSNIDIWVHFPVAGVTFTKADGDQDRPN